MLVSYSSLLKALTLGPIPLSWGDYEVLIAH